jgi:hypothetical protein
LKAPHCRRTANPIHADGILRPGMCNGRATVNFSLLFSIAGG